MGYELLIQEVSVISGRRISHQPQEHGVDFLLDHRHLWMRTPRQVAIMQIRNTVVKAIRDWLDSQGFTLVDAPILTPAACRRDHHPL